MNIDFSHSYGILCDFEKLLHKPNTGYMMVGWFEERKVTKTYVDTSNNITKTNDLFCDNYHWSTLEVTNWIKQKCD